MWSLLSRSTTTRSPRKRWTFARVQGAGGVHDPVYRPARQPVQPGNGEWSVNDISPQGYALLAIEATVNTSGPYDLVATVESGQPDPDLTNNTATVSVAPDQNADLMLNF